MIKVENLRKSYQMGAVEVRALDGVSLTAEQGEYLGIVGASGSGKSPPMHIPLFYARDGHKPDASPKMLELVGLGDRMSHHPNELSGGQQQRVAIARALVNNPSIIFADEPTGNLDSRSAREIMQVMSELHAQGLTIILVTHDANVASHAQRIIEIKDGRILADFLNPESPEIPPVEKVEREDAVHAATALHSLKEGVVLVKQSLRSLLANKVRTALSALGIMIGVAAVITTVAVGNGAKQAVEKQMSRLGSNLMVLYPQRRSRGGIQQAQGSVSRLELSDVKAIRDQVQHVLRVSGTVDESAQLKVGNKNWNSRVTGVEVDYEAMRATEPQLGRFFTQEEDDNRERVVLLGLVPVKELFEGANPIGREIKINRQSFTVIGVLPEKGSSGFRDYDDAGIIPLNTAMKRLFGEEYVERIEIQADLPENMERIQADVLALMESRHRTGTQENPFEIRNLAEIQDAYSETSKVMSLLLSSIASIALVVGGIGIMNIMLVSVTERTREIGLRKALGARRSDIMFQFLIEALIISFFGGCLGILLGRGAGYLVERFAGMPVLFTQDSIYMAFGFSAIIGIVFGMWPARKASLLNPIDALRYE